MVGLRSAVLASRVGASVATAPRGVPRMEKGWREVTWVGILLWGVSPTEMLGKGTAGAGSV